MSDPRAIVVDDAAADRSRTSSALKAAGFRVDEFSDTTSFLDALNTDTGLIDLIVLDRQLPTKLGEQASNSIGDELLSAVLAISPDQKIIIFSGHSDYDHLQFAQSDRGSIELRSGTISFDRVTVLRKGQSLEFDQKSAELNSCLREIEDIHVDVPAGTSMSLLNKRVLRRVAFEFGAASIQCRALSGGASGEPVWLCEIRTADSVSARVVVKVQKTRVGAGGFQSVLPAPLLAGTTHNVGGFCGGRFAAVQQVAGADPVPVMTLLTTAPEEATTAILRLTGALDTLPSGLRLNLPLEEVLQPFGTWDQLCGWAAKGDIALPSRSKICPMVRRLQHGDLHPGNILIVDGRPVMIDFDRQTQASSLLDPVILTFSPMFHPSSPVRSGAWPDSRFELLGSASFFETSPYASFGAHSWEWLTGRAGSQLEIYAVMLGYSLRQLKYPDILGSSDLLQRAIAMARWASEALSSD